MAGVEVLEVIDPGLLTTVQDAGRPGLEREGVTPGGAADPWSLAVANALVGNPPDAAALELTLLGPVLRAARRLTIALAGTIPGTIEGADEGRTAVEPGTAVTLPAGAMLRLDGRAAGARGYLALPGGVDVPSVLGSRSTALGAGFGGLDGRPLRAGDRLLAGAPEGTLVTPPARWPGDASPPPGPLRVLPGPHAGDLGEAAFDTLATGDWTVSPASDRVGLRLDGPAIPAATTGELASHGVVTGTIQLPPDRRPIVLLPDHQTTGGYPVIGVVIRADLPALGQLAPGAPVRFVATTPAAAGDELAARGRAFDAALQQVREHVRWDDLWRWAR